MLLNSGEVQAKLSAAGSRAEKLAKDPRPDEQKIDELFWDAFARGPTKPGGLKRARAPQETHRQPPDSL